MDGPEAFRAMGQWMKPHKEVTQASKTPLTRVPLGAVSNKWAPLQLSWFSKAELTRALSSHDLLSPGLGAGRDWLRLPGCFLVVTAFGHIFDAIISVGLCLKFIWMGTVSWKLDKWSNVWGQEANEWSYLKWLYALAMWHSGKLNLVYET